MRAQRTTARAALGLLLLAGTVAPARAATPAPAPQEVVVHTTIVFGTPPDAPAALASATWVRDSISYVISHYTGFNLGPSRYTGYGQAHVSAIRKASCSGCSFYSVTITVTNHQPVSPVAEPGTTAAASSICWPWQDSLSCSSWNNINSWDWKAILKILDTHPVDRQSTPDRIYGCYKRIYRNVAIRGTGSLAGVMVDGLSTIVRITPPQLAWTAIGTCTAYLVHLG